MLKSSYYGGALAARGNKFTSRGKLRPQIRTYHYSSKVPNPLVHSEVDSGAMGVPVRADGRRYGQFQVGLHSQGGLRHRPPRPQSQRGGGASCTPLAHLLHTSGTPLAHPWHASRAPLAAAPDCRRRRIPRPPKETTTSHSQRKKFTSRGKRFPPHSNLVLPLVTSAKQAFW